MPDVRINALPAENSPVASEVVPIDGATTRKTTIQKLVDSGAPIASQAEAEAGTNPTKRMVPLTTKQSIASEVGVTIASKTQGDKADAALQPTTGISKLADFDALDGSTSLASLLTDEQREWMFLPGDFSADLALQGYENFYIPPTSDPTGESGVYALVGAAPTGSWYTDDTPPARIPRLNDRLFGGAAAYLSYGSSQEWSPGFTKRLHSWLDGWEDEDGGLHQGPGFYLEHSAQWLVLSTIGGIGITGASRTSDKYSFYEYDVLVPSSAVDVGDKIGWQNRLYTVTVAGTLSATPPSHTSGTAANGTATLQYDGVTPGTTIGVAAIGISDVSDGIGSWAFYNEAQKDPDGGTIIGREIAVKDKGANVNNNPYMIFPAGASIGDWFAGGGDPVTGAPTSPSTAASIIGMNGHTWNIGYMVAADGLTSVGARGMVAYGMAEDHRIAWFTAESASVPEGYIGAFIDSDVDETAKQTGMTFSNDSIIMSARGARLATFENAAGASDPNYLRFFSTTGNAAILPGGAGANIGVSVQGKGTGNASLSSSAGSELISANTTGIGFYGTPPVARPTLSAAATDAASTQTLANSIRTALITLGLTG